MRTSTFTRALAAFAVMLACSLATAADEKEQIENPFYKFWSKSKVGSSVTLKETTKLPVTASETGGEEVKMIKHTLTQINADKAVVQTIVTEGEVFGFVESAPTKHIYPAKMSKEVLEDLIKETGAKAEPQTIKVGDKEMKVMYLSGTMKKGTEEVEFKLWLSEDVPGAIVKRVRVTKVKGDVVAETTIEVISFDKK